ncbi:hypothetical protein Verru16b_02185 [Lacunisphaera limnophila]|uniref:Uncharacterized protein n=1 Tax=Lacunisphaera limnophila TaxID=1838286 RepID=A0A1D8AW42_9BACT|nr:hypothetical protein [Lacunisphaera limnophila]AOS45109.1 hypothetical protein Verru16b_02185 [Lacunisphaera limnophila]
MHDFIQRLSFHAPRDLPSALPPAVPEWVRLSLLRSFGEDHPTGVRPAFAPPARPPRRTRPAGRPARAKAAA